MTSEEKRGIPIITEVPLLQTSETKHPVKTLMFGSAVESSLAKLRKMLLYDLPPPVEELIPGI